MLYLGVMHTLCKALLWQLLTSGALATAGTLDEEVAASIEWVDQDLERFYRRHHDEHPNEVLTRINAFTSKQQERRRLGTGPWLRQPLVLAKLVSQGR